MKSSMLMMVLAMCVMGVPLHAQETRQSFKPRTRISDAHKAADAKKQRELAQQDDVQSSAVAQKPGVESSVIDETDTLSSPEFANMRDRVIAFVDMAVEHLQKNPVQIALSDFMHDKKFESGGLYVFVYNDKGFLLSQGGSPDLVWTNEYDIKDAFGIPTGKTIIDKARQGGGWVTYELRNTTKITYTREVKKDDVAYIIGAGFYPHSPRDGVVNMVRGAVQMFNDARAAGRSAQEVFSSFSYQLGRFVNGSLYLYALDFDGTIVAQGDVPSLVGQNALEYKDANGIFTNKEIIKKLKDVAAGTGVWVDYVSKNAPKKAYAEKVTDAGGKNYFIAAGYYPTANKDAIVKLVKDGREYAQTRSIEQVATAFNKDPKFVFGDASLYLIETDGKVLAYRNNASFVGTNRLTEKDQDGESYIKQMIDQIKKDPMGSWFNYRLKNSFFSAYAEGLTLENKLLVLGSGLYALSRYETMVLLVKSAVGFLKGNKETDSFLAFSNDSGPFSRGDLNLFVLDAQGYCYVYVDHLPLVWDNLMDRKDDDGKEYIKQFINTALSEPGKVSYRLNGIKRSAYVESVKKGEKTYIIGSSLYE